MEWSKTVASRVCDECFGGDLAAMREYASTYLREGHTGVRPLGATFRNLLPGRARRPFWETASRQIDAYLHGSTAVTAAAGARELPDWTARAGGEQRWRRWVVKKAASCVRRATKAAAKRRDPPRLPTRSEWLAAIWAAVCRSDGRGHFSRLPLSLETDRSETHPCWPSVEHTSGPLVAEVGLELRVFNDLKTILSLDELRKVVGHLAVTMNAPLVKLDDGWHCRRSYAVEQPDAEPPLPAE